MGVAGCEELVEAMHKAAATNRTPCEQVKGVQYWAMYDPASKSEEVRETVDAKQLRNGKKTCDGVFNDVAIQMAL